MDISSAVAALMQAVRNRLPVTGQTSDPVHGTVIMGGWPRSTKPGTESMRWLIERSTAEGSVDLFLWNKLEPNLAGIDRALREVARLMETHGQELAPLKKPFNRFLGQRLFARSYGRSEDGERKHLVIEFFSSNDQVLVKLHGAALALGMPRPKRKAVQREKLMEERDKLIHESACQGMSYSDIAGLVRRKYPVAENRGFLHISTQRAWQVAHEYATRKGLPLPPARQQRRE
jgi:hypothetical protein